MTMFEYIKQLIERGEYNLEDLEQKVKRLYLLGDITDEEMDELLTMAADKADNSAQVDLYALIVDLQHKVVELENRVAAIESEEPAEDSFAVWANGYTTKKGEIVLFDIDGDGSYEYVMYDGGRSQGTSLSPGKIEGWYQVTRTGEKTATLTRNADGTYTVTPIESND